MNANNQLIYLIALNHFPKFGQKSLKKLKDHFPTWKDAFWSGEKGLIAAGLRDSIVSEFVSARNSINLDQLSEQMLKENIGAIELGNSNYSKLLAEIYDPPQLLFYKGSISLFKTTCLAIVGTRKCTNYGQQVTFKFCAELVKNNFTIVSGLALGIDSVAHNATLDNHGATIAVLGTGLDKASIYPSSNRYLADKIIAENGLVITEFSLGTAPQRYNFPLRNRIISGLSLGTLVIESAEKSGALITARCALEQNREVFAVPGNIFSEVSAGPNSLIKQGAITTTSVETILETLDLKLINSYINNKIVAESPEEEKLLPHLSHEPTHVDELVRLSGLGSAELSSTLTLMEMRGLIKNFGGMRYALI